MANSKRGEFLPMDVGDKHHCSRPLCVVVGDKHFKLDPSGLGFKEAIPPMVDDSGNNSFDKAAAVGGDPIH